jgi:hypothetical protein
MSTTLDAETTANDNVDDLEELELLQSGTTLAGALNDLAFLLLTQSYVVTPRFA